MFRLSVVFCVLAPCASLNRNTAQLVVVNQGAELDAHSGIPRILHRVMLPNEKGSLTCDKLMKTTRDHFHTQNPDWVEYVWGNDAIDALLRTSQAMFSQEEGLEDFESLYRGMSQWIYQQDTIRHLILYNFGGLYLDTDMDCQANISSLIDEHDLVIRAHGKTNFLAAKPHHKFFLDMMKRIGGTFRVGNLLVTTPLELTGEKQIAATLKSRDVNSNIDKAKGTSQTMQNPNYGVVRVMGSNDVINDFDIHKLGKYQKPDEDFKCVHRPANAWHYDGSAVPIKVDHPDAEIELAKVCPEVYDERSTWGEDLIHKL